MTDALSSATEADTVATRSNGDYNRAAIKRHVLKVSRLTRSGKINRVSEEGIDNIIAAIEARIRSFEAPVLNAPLGQVEPDDDNNFLTGAGRLRLNKCFNVWIGREIHRMLNNVRVGRTF